MISQRFAQTLGLGYPACCLGHNHEIEAAQPCLLVSKCIAHDPLDPVSIQRAPRNPARHRDSQARVCQMVHEGMYRE